jgi:cell division protein FtsQ
MWDNPTLLKNTSTALFAVSALLLVYGALYYALHLPSLLPIQTVKLSFTPQQVDAQQVLQVTRETIRGNFFTVNIEQLKSELEKLAWVREVQIRREFPNRLVVELTEHVAFARWNTVALVNVQGEVFNAQTEQILPAFLAPQGESHKLAERYVAINLQLAPLALHVVQLSESDRFAWQIRLNNGMVLELGGEEIEARLAKFVAVYPYSFAAQVSTIKTIDLRYRNGFAVGSSVKQS